MSRRGEGTLEVPTLDLVLGVGEAMDLMAPELEGHHLRVATVAVALAKRLGLPEDRLRDLAVAAALHDAGAFSLAERLDTLAFHVRRTEHAEAGWLILRTFGPFARAARIVRHHHVPWEGGAGERRAGDAVPLEAHLLHLADRVTVLVRDRGSPLPAGRQALARVREHGGELFVPELVRALEEAAAVERFWFDAAAGNPAVVAEAIPEDVVLALGDLKGVVRVLWHLVDFRSRFTATHTSGVAAVAAHLAALCGFDEEEVAAVRLAAGLHDFGKLAIPGEVLDSELTLDDRTRGRIQAHPYHSWRILGRMRGLQRLSAWAAQHHERLDGSGYPFHLRGERIPLESRIVAVADVFTALTEERPYRRGMSAREATGRLLAMAEKGELDPGVVDEAVRNRDDANALRRAAQERAAGQFLELRGRATAPTWHAAGVPAA